MRIVTFEAVGLAYFQTASNKAALNEINMKILPRFFGITLLLTSLILGGKLVHDAIIFQFWTTPWSIGVIASLVLIAMGLGLLFLEDDETGYLALSIFGCIYVIAAALVYIAWGIRQVFNTGDLEDFAGFGTLFVAVAIVAAIGLGITADRKGWYKIYLFPAWIAGIANLAIIFLILFKYIFARKDWHFWPFAAEVVISIVGSALFLSSYNEARKGEAKKPDQEEPKSTKID